MHRLSAAWQLFSMTFTAFTFCPKHAAQVSEWAESRYHLLDLIAPAVAAWYQHWKERGLSERDLEGTMKNLEPYLKDLADGA